MAKHQRKLASLLALASIFEGVNDNYEDRPMGTHRQIKPKKADAQKKKKRKMVQKSKRINRSK